MHSAEKDAPNPYRGTPLEGWADAMQEADAAMDDTLAAAKDHRVIPPG